MEKIVLVINAQNPDTSSMDFACEMAALNQSKLTGVFLENLSFEDPTGVGIEGPFHLETVTETNKATNVITEVEEAIAIFKERCLHKGVAEQICVYKDQLVKKVVLESRFADLLIIDPETGMYDRDGKLPSHFVKEILVKAECPVLLPPEKFDIFSEIVFCYNNTASSVFAIKQFTYLFPQFRYKNVMLLEVIDPGTNQFREHHIKLMDWLRAHYNSVYYHALTGDVEDELVNYFIMKRKKMIVMGAYGRSMLSSFFKRSSADVLIRKLDVPLFITHH